MAHFAKLGIDNEDILVGMCARFHKVKNFPLLIDSQLQPDPN